MNNINEYDERQLDLMLRQLNLFENNSKEIRGLISKLEGILSAMEHLDEKWDIKYWSELSTLESIDAGTPGMEEYEVQKLIKETIFNLKELTKEELTNRYKELYTKKDLLILDGMLENINIYMDKKTDVNNLNHILDDFFNKIITINKKWLNEFSNILMDLNQKSKFLSNNLKIENCVNTLKKMIKDEINNCKKLLSEEKKKELSESIPEIREIAQELGESWLMCPLCQDAWEDHSTYGMVRCPGCQSKLHNPTFKS